MFNKLLCLVLLSFIFSCTISKKENNEYPGKEYKIYVNKENVSFHIKYQGMLSPSTFVMSHCSVCENPNTAYYPIGIDTLFDGKHAFIVKEVTPRYIVLKALY
jgi:hypothetical protein